MFKIDERAVINENARSGMPDNIGELVTVIDVVKSPNYDYCVRFQNGTVSMVKGKELNDIDENELIYNLELNETVLYTPLDMLVRVEKIDYLHKQVEIDYMDGSHEVVDVSKLQRSDKRLLADVIPTEEVESSLKHFVKTFFGHYEKKKGFYEIPEQLLERLLTSKFCISEE